MTTFLYTLFTPPAADAEDELAHETDHASVALRNHLWQYDTPRFRAFLQSIIEAMQPIEDIAWQYYTIESRLASASGVNLDALGAIVGEKRAERADELYRSRIGVRILVNRSHGRMPDLYEILGKLDYDDYRVFQYINVYVIDATGSLDPTGEMELFRVCRPAGIDMRFVYSVYSVDETFQASGTYATTEYDAATGAGSVYDATTGGRSAGVFT